MSKPARQPKRPAGVSRALLAAAVCAQGDGVVISRFEPREGKLRVVFANEVFLRLTGRSLNDVVGRTHAELHADPADFNDVTRPRARGRRPAARSGEGSVLRKDGGTFYAAWSLSTLATRAGRVTHVVGTYRDTTEKRRLQEALAHAQRLDAVGRLAGGVAHDFNNLLSVINGYCEILAAQVSDRAAALREVNEIHRAGLRAAALTRQLLAFGRRTPIDPRVTSLNRIVQENAEIMQRLIGAAGRLELELAPDLPNVRTDPIQFQQVILNLVLNARDALRDRGRIVISTGERDVRAARNQAPSDVPPGRYVCLAVSDNGTGMDAETQKHLFEPFFTTKAEGKGSGLGLALVYGVVQQSGGFVQVRSALLAGSTFEIFLPRVTAPEEGSSDAPIAPLSTANTGHESLLLLEADEVVRKMVAGLLTASGYRVRAARNVGEAAAANGERGLQLVIAPMEPAAQAFVKKLHAAAPALRTVWVGNESAPTRVEWLAESRQSRISKPFALSEILRVVRALLDA